MLPQDLKRNYDEWFTPLSSEPLPVVAGDDFGHYLHLQSWEVTSDTNLMFGEIGERLFYGLFLEGREILLDRENLCAVLVKEGYRMIGLTWERLWVAHKMPMTPAEQPATLWVRDVGPSTITVIPDEELASQGGPDYILQMVFKSALEDSILNHV